MSTPTTTPPAIGQFWPGQGGIYAGIARGRDGQPDHHLVLAQSEYQECPTWQAAMDHAKAVQVDGHADFALPTRWQAALLFANVRDHLDTDHWHWTSTEYEGNASYAWICYFGYGYQTRYPKSYEGGVVAVRSIPLTA